MMTIEPATTEVQPTSIIIKATVLSKEKELLTPFLEIAPIPRKTTATLWVPRAVAKGSPKRINIGNWMKPAPPPETLAKRFATKVTVNKIPCLIISSVTNLSLLITYGLKHAKQYHFCRTCRQNEYS